MGQIYRKSEKEPKEKTKKISALILALMLLGCVKTVYLPEEAGYYKKLYDGCQAEKAATEDVLEECLSKGEQIRRELF